MTDTRASVAPAAANPCRACPWLIENHGKPHPDGWYTKRNRDRLWVGLRNGEQMSCHPTDPRNPVSDRAAEAGYQAAPEHAQTRVCTGGLVLQQREMQLFSEAESLAAYRRARPRGMTRTGLWALANRLVFGGTCLGGDEMTRPNLNAQVGHDPLPWTTRTAEATE